MGIDSYSLNMHGSSKEFPPAFDAGEGLIRKRYCRTKTFSVLQGRS